MRNECLGLLSESTSELLKVAVISVCNLRLGHHSECLLEGLDILYGLKPLSEGDLRSTAGIVLNDGAI